MIFVMVLLFSWIVLFYDVVDIRLRYSFLVYNLVISSCASFIDIIVFVNLVML